VTRKEPVAKNAEALKRTDGAAPQNAIVIGLSPKLAPKKRASAKKAEASKVAELPTSLVNMRHQTFAPSMLPVGGSTVMPHRTIGDVERPESFIPWPLGHLPRPAAFAPRQSSSLSREPPAGRAAYPSSTHLLRKSSQIQGFITRTKAEPYDQIAGDCCDLFSRWVKEWQSHRGALVVSGLRKLDVAPS
jgi:hypothetical protein